MVEKRPHCQYTNNRISAVNCLARFKCDVEREREIIETEKTRSRDERTLGFRRERTQTVVFTRTMNKEFIFAKESFSSELNQSLR